MSKDYLKEESEELITKINKLEFYLATEQYTYLESKQRTLLKLQLYTMNAYSLILLERLKT